MKLAYLQFISLVSSFLSGPAFSSLLILCIATMWDIYLGFRSRGFSLCGFGLCPIGKSHRLKPVLLVCIESLFFPRIAADMISVLFPEARLILRG